MNSRTLDCSHYASCKWEKKYRQKEEELKSAIENLNENERIYNAEIANHHKKLQIHETYMKQLQIAQNKRKSKIAQLKQTIIKKNEEIRDLNYQIEDNKRKISRHSNFKHQSIDLINRLEDENEKTKRLLLTPVTRVKKERKSMKSVNELSIKIIPFSIAETPQTRNTELEEVIEDQYQKLQKKRKKNKDLKNRLTVLQKENKSLQENCKYIENSNAAAKLRLEHEKQDLTSKLEQMRIDNLELIAKIKELVMNQSSQNTSGFLSDNLRDEILGVDASHLGSFEECRTHFPMSFPPSFPTSFEQEEKQKLITMLEVNLNALKVENEELKEKLKVKEKNARELNKILKENHLAFENFRRQYACADVQAKVKALDHEKKKIMKEIEMKRIELNELHKKTIEKKVELDRISELSIEDSIRNSMANLISRQKVFPEDCKRRRNIGSWGYGLLNSL